MSEERTAEDYKKLGNEAFAAKSYDEAIEQYTKAINADPENAIYYSNRCACYSAMKNWQAAKEDATVCVSKDPSFIKGYYRLSVAHTELLEFDDANNVLKEAIRRDPENDQLQKQMRILRSKKAASKERAARPGKTLDDAQRKELMELQEQTMAYGRDLRGVSHAIASVQRELRSVAVTAQQITSYETTVPLYRSVGKGFLLSPRDDIEGHLAKEAEKLDKNQKDLEGRKEYLERRIASNRSNMQDITSTST